MARREIEHASWRVRARICERIPGMTTPSADLRLAFAIAMLLSDTLTYWDEAEARERLMATAA